MNPSQAGISRMPTLLRKRSDFFSRLLARTWS
jgi:hypothetical protein